MTYKLYLEKFLSETLNQIPWNALTMNFYALIFKLAWTKIVYIHITISKFITIHSNIKQSNAKKMNYVQYFQDHFVQSFIKMKALVYHWSKNFFNLKNFIISNNQYKMHKQFPWIIYQHYRRSLIIFLLSKYKQLKILDLIF